MKIHGPCVRKSNFHGEILRLCLANVVVRDSVFFFNKATRYTIISASGGNPCTAGTFLPPPGGKHYLRTLDPAERNAVAFFAEIDFTEMRCV